MERGWSKNTIHDSVQCSEHNGGVFEILRGVFDFEHSPLQPLRKLLQLGPLKYLDSRDLYTVVNLV